MSAQTVESRRRFLAEAARAACGAGVLAALLAGHAARSRTRPPQAIRPPGARAEAEFLGACVRCGLCVRDCPYDILALAAPADAVATGTPYFVARQAPCEMCEDLPCVKACPTGALDHGLTDVLRARMGLAVLVDHENCLNHLGLRCDICHRVCPVIDKAITLDRQLDARTGRHTRFIPVVHAEHCTGCGKCEKACPLDRAAIKVLPPELARGAPGSHYRLGWIEKDRSGGSLVAPDPAHRYTLPPGQQYEPGLGLRRAPDAAGGPGAAPGASVPAASAAGVPVPRALQGDRL